MDQRDWPDQEDAGLIAAVRRYLDGLHVVKHLAFLSHLVVSNLLGLLRLARLVSLILDMLNYFNVIGSSLLVPYQVRLE